MEQKTGKTKIMIVDDHSLLRDSFISMFKYDPEFEVIADAPNGHKAIMMLYRIQPDIVLLDIDMPLMNGKETLEFITKYHPKIKVVMLTMYADSFHEKEFKMLGASSFIAKNTEREDFFRILKEVSKGKYQCTLTNDGDVIPKKNNRHLELSLSYREQTIVQYVCNNLTSEEIAQQLKISVNTVRYYRKVISTKTLTTTVADLVKYAIRQGLISAN